MPVGFLHHAWVGVEHQGKQILSAQRIHKEAGEEAAIAPNIRKMSDVSEGQNSLVRTFGKDFSRDQQRIERAHPISYIAARQ